MKYIIIQQHGTTDSSAASLAMVCLHYKKETIIKTAKTYFIVGDLGIDLLRIEIDELYKNFSGPLLILKPNQDFESGKVKVEKIFNRFLKLLLPQKKLCIYSIFASIILTISGIGFSLFNKVIMD